MAKISKSLAKWIAECPVEKTPLFKLLQIIDSPETGISQKIEACGIAARYFAPILSSSVNKVEGVVDHKQVAVGRYEVISALASLSVEERHAVLAGRRVLSLEPPSQPEGDSQNDPDTA